MFQLAAAVTTPFDVVKTIRQIELAEKEIITGKLLKQSNSVAICLSK